MKSSNRFARRRGVRTNDAQRARLLSAFNRSGLSAAAFARQHGLNYTTFCGWRQRWAKVKTSPDFVQVEVPATVAPAELVIEVGTQARIRIHSESQIAWVARLLQSVNTATLNRNDAVKKEPPIGE